MRAAVQTEHGVYEVDLEEELVLELDEGARLDVASVETGLPLVVAAVRSGATVIAVVERRPPLAISNDAGSTWREAGGGLPPGRAVAIADDDPDLVVYAARNRLYLSRDGGRFWTALALELPEIEAVAWLP
ncbi:MAG TPA: hypothetical protein VG073_01655 [Gaiellaceae bacterium]|nr:hypothetical protein [Gaiellaceae bacterium]